MRKVREVEAQMGLYFLQGYRLHRAAGVTGIWEDNRYYGITAFCDSTLQ